MRDGVCPRCNSESVYKKLNGIISGDKRIHVRGIGRFGSPPSDKLTYVCSACGYYENYVIDNEFLSRIRAKWDKVK